MFPNSQDRVTTDGHIVITTEPDGHINLYEVEGNQTHRVGRYDNVATAWAALDELEDAA